MVKTVVISLTKDIPETELGKDATVTIGENSYTGKVAAIILHMILTQASGTVTLEAAGLKTVP